MNGFRDLYFSCDSFVFSLLPGAAPKEWWRSLSAYKAACGASFAYVSQRRVVALCVLKLRNTSWIKSPSTPSTPTLAFQKFISLWFK